MKNITKTFGIIAFVALIGLSMAALSLTGCDTGGGGSSTGGGGGGGGSSDMTWTAVTTSTFGSTDVIYGIAYGNNTFVAVGDKGKIAYSTDGGQNWTPVTAGTGTGKSQFNSDSTGTIYSIAYGNNTFVAGGASGKMAYSTDNGKNWTAVTTSQFGTTEYINAIAWGNDKFVAGGGVAGYNGKMAYSSDGTSWTTVTDSKFSNTNYGKINAIAYGNNKFVAAGSEGRTTTNDLARKIAYSTNGTTWTAATASSSDSNKTINAIAYGGNNKFVVGGQNNDTGYSSDGGNTWTYKETYPFFPVNGIVWDSSKFVAVGANGNMATSPDGITWTTISAGTGSGKSQFDTHIHAIAYDGNGTFVAVGDNGKIAYSTGN